MVRLLLLRAAPCACVTRGAANGSFAQIYPSHRCESNSECKLWWCHTGPCSQTPEMDENIARLNFKRVKYSEKNASDVKQLNDQGLTVRVGDQTVLLNEWWLHEYGQALVTRGNGNKKRKRRSDTNNDDETQQLLKSLGLPGDLDLEAQGIAKKLRIAYHQMAARTHPDKNPDKSPDEFIEIKNSYDSLLRMTEEGAKHDELVCLISAIVAVTTSETREAMVFPGISTLDTEDKQMLYARLLITLNGDDEDNSFISVRQPRGRRNLDGSP